MVENKPDIVLLGCGFAIHRFPPFLSRYLNDLGFQIEILSSKQAASTYNVLSEEGRNIALALLPLIPTSPVTKKVLVELQKD
jgi:NADH dehydrogenase [ubiquinone] 1 alpha subcomplex assembly factor 3